MIKIQKLNKQLLILAFFIANILWIKTLYDIFNFSKIRPAFSFPKFFIILFVVGAIVTFLLSYFCVKNLRTEKYATPISTGWTFLYWLAIPISVICVSPVCYMGNIFMAAYPVSAVIRIGLLVVPIIAGFLYYNQKKELAIFILLILSFLLLIPNDKCYNPFNHWWIDIVGASPLTYLPTMFVILFGVTGLYGKNKFLITIILYGLCAAALFLAVGHRIRLLW